MAAKLIPQCLVCTPEKRICYQNDGLAVASNYCGNRDNTQNWWCPLPKGHDGAHVGCRCSGNGPSSNDNHHNVFIWESK